MKAKFIQKMMAGALTAALIAAPSMSVFASSSSAGSSAPVVIPEESVEEPVVTVEDEVVAIVNASIETTVSAGDAAAVSSIAAIPTTSTVAGAKSTVQGVYLATSVNGTAITSGLSNIAGSYGLGSGEVPYARFTNMDADKSTAAKAVIDSAAESLGAEVGPCINIEIGKKSSGKFSLLSSDGAEIAVKIGIPKSFAQDDRTFAVVCVRPGGAVSVLKDTDTDPNTVTVETTGGQGAYAIVRY